MKFKVLFGIFRSISNKFNIRNGGYRVLTQNQSPVFRFILNNGNHQMWNYGMGRLACSALVAIAGLTPKDDKKWLREKDVAHQITLAETAIKDGDFKKAEKLLEEALAIGDSTETIGITCVYDMLATIAYRQGDVSKAETVLMEAVSRLAEKGTASNHNTIVNFSLKLARIYSMNGQDDLAELGFRNCLAIQKKKYMSGENDEETATLWVNTLFWYGKFLACRERFVEAKQCFDSAYTMCTHVKSIDANQVMVMLYNLGEMSFATGDLEDALRHLQNAVILGKSTNSPDLASYYTKIGLIYMHKGIYKEASHWCQWGLDTASRHHDKKASGEAQDCIKHLRTLLDKA